MHIRSESRAQMRLRLNYKFLLFLLLTIIVFNILNKYIEFGNTRPIGKQNEYGGLMIGLHLALAICGIHYDFYDNALVCRWFGIPFRRVPWSKVGEVGLINGGKKCRNMQECIKTGDAHIIMTLGSKVHFRPGRMNFKRVIDRAILFRLRHPLSTVVIMPLEKKDVSGYINFVLQHTGKKLSFG